MNIETAINNAVAAQRAEEFKTSPQLSLSELILKLEAIQDKSKPVQFEFGYLHPTFFESYRGYYSDLAICFSEKGDAPTVEQFLAQAKECMGKTFEGYKGGDYVMGKTTPIWVANTGNSGGTGVVGIREASYLVYLQTAIVEE